MQGLFIQNLKRWVGSLLATAFLGNTCYALDSNEESVHHVLSGDYDYLVYAVTWQPTFCLFNPLSNGCRQVEADFYTHGIWPYYFSHDQKTNCHPAYCSESPGCITHQDTCELNDSDLRSVKNNAAFISIMPEGPEKLMKHEWKKHGTCYGKNQVEYFSDFIKFRKAVKVNSEFNHFIGKSVSIKKLRRAFPGNSFFRCDDKHGKQYLLEVFFLVDQQGNPFEKENQLQIGKACDAQNIFIPHASQRQ